MDVVLEALKLYKARQQFKIAFAIRQKLISHPKLSYLASRGIIVLEIQSLLRTEWDYHAI
jgi:hypothetical protein